jgi:hypothetical protein
MWFQVRSSCQKWNRDVMPPSGPVEIDAIAELDNNRDRLGPHVACFGDGFPPASFRALTWKK